MAPEAHKYHNIREKHSADNKNVPLLTSLCCTEGLVQLFLRAACFRSCGVHQCLPECCINSKLVCDLMCESGFGLLPSKRVFGDRRVALSRDQIQVSERTKPLCELKNMSVT
ncbi:hypothetical protein GOODEAATRI_027158 [Goodea atripinnis]|uniref:Uncharacterized protein n=1 Tax=Goodea atripinnis TaxID=208336 RepID=A0ABV0P880_9TELE